MRIQESTENHRRVLGETGMRIQNKVMYNVFVWIAGVACGYTWAWLALT